MNKTYKLSNVCLPVSDSGWEPAGNIEASYTIIRQFVSEKNRLITLDALTPDGWLRSLGIECDEEMRELALQAYRPVERHWRTSKSPSFVLPISTGFASEEPTPPDWVDVPEKILVRLESEATDDEDFELAILVAEVTAFDDQQRPRLLAALENYISSHRFVTDEDDITHLGAAIRKYAMNMDEPHFEGYANWLVPDETEPMEHAVELELAKGICRRLTYEPFEPNGDYPGLMKALDDLAAEYLSPRLIVQDSYASTVRFAVVALVILYGMANEDERLVDLMRRVHSINREWFSILIDDRIEEAAESISTHAPQLAEHIRQCVGNAT